MVAIKSSEAERFLDRPAAHIFFYLIFGPDAGLVAERARAIAAQAVDDPKDPFQLVRLAGDDLAADPLRLADEANSIPLFGGKRAIWIEAQGRAFLDAIEPVLAAPPRDCTIVISAGALKKDAALRKICEREKNAAAIECHHDGEKDIARLIESEVAAAGLSIGPDARIILASMLGKDRASSRAELAKLCLFAHGEGEIRLDHVEAIVSNASSLMLDHAVNGAFQGDLAGLESSVQRIFREAVDPGQLIGAALRHAVSLHRARIELEAGPDGGGARRGATSGLSGAAYGRAGAFEAHLRAWTSARLARIIDALAEATGRARREPKLAKAIAQRALWSVAQTIAQAGRAARSPR